MKIIAQVRAGYDPKFIVEIDGTEISLMAWGDSNERPRGGFTIGQEIKVGAHWERMIGIRAAEQSLKQSAGSLRALADLLETINVAVTKTPQPANEGGAK